MPLLVMLALLLSLLLPLLLLPGAVREACFEVVGEQ
jgi:hypothetical protein